MNTLEPEILSAGLYVVATPIGNLSDLTLRALETLKKVDAIACEDTRQSLKLLTHFGIRKPLTSIFGPKEVRETPKIVRWIEEGKSVALMTDAGTPGISDPGQELVSAVRNSGGKVVPIPGVSALSTILSISGHSGNGCIFLGFLRRDKGKIKKELRAAAESERLIIFYESPHRVLNTLKIVQEIFGDETYCCVAREMTKKFETYLTGPVASVLQQLSAGIVKGELTLAIRPKTKKFEPSTKTEIPH